MSEETFRIIVTVAVLLACIAFLVQAGVAVALFLAIRKTQRKVSPIIDKVSPIIDKVDPIVETVGKIVEDARPQIAEIGREAVEIAKNARKQVERVGDVLNDASERAKERLEQIDRSVDSTIEHLEHAGGSVKRAMMKPVREINGIAAGISAAVSTLAHSQRKSSVDHATLDEEMFI
jgi:phage-related protein